METYLEKWTELGLEFDGIFSGFLLVQKHRLGSSCLRFAGLRKGYAGGDRSDHGGSRKGVSDLHACHVRRMKELVGLGDLVTPNLTEACILTGREYREEGWHRADLQPWRRNP